MRLCLACDNGRRQPAAGLGRSPDPVAVVQPDQMMNCTAILAEIQANNAQVQQHAKVNGWKVAQNVAAGVSNRPRSPDGSRVWDFFDARHTSS